MVPMTDNVQFKANFYNTNEALVIFSNEHINDVVHYKNNIVHIHCKTTNPDPYLFTILVDNSIYPLITLYFLSSL